MHLTADCTQLLETNLTLATLMRYRTSPNSEFFQCNRRRAMARENKGCSLATSPPPLLLLVLVPPPLLLLPPTPPPLLLLPKPLGASALLLLAVFRRARAASAASSLDSARQERVESMTTLEVMCGKGMSTFEVVKMYRAPLVDMTGTHTPGSFIDGPIPSLCLGFTTSTHAPHGFCTSP